MEWCTLIQPTQCHPLTGPDIPINQTPHPNILSPTLQSVAAAAQNNQPCLDSPQSITLSEVSSDRTRHELERLERLLDSSLATVAIIQISGNTIADVLTPRAYDAFKALYALVALDVSFPNSNRIIDPF